jgi:hypothetical protein
MIHCVVFLEIRQPVGLGKFDFIVLPVNPSVLSQQSLSRTDFDGIALDLSHIHWPTMQFAAFVGGIWQIAHQRDQRDAGLDYSEVRS